MSKMSLRVFTITSPSAVSDPQILKLILNDDLVQTNTEYHKVIQ